MKWKINVRFMDNAAEEFETFRQRMLRSGVKGLKASEFDSKKLIFTHTCDEPKDVFDFFWLLNPINSSDDIYDKSWVTIVRGDAPREGRYPWGKSDKSQKKQGI